MIPKTKCADVTSEKLSNSVRVRSRVISRSKSGHNLTHGIITTMLFSSVSWRGATIIALCGSNMCVARCWRILERILIPAGFWWAVCFVWACFFGNWFFLVRVKVNPCAAEGFGSALNFINVSMTTWKTNIMCSWCRVWFVSYGVGLEFQNFLWSISCYLRFQTYKDGENIIYLVVSHLYG